MTGTDFLLESILKLAGVDIENAKAQILDLGKKFHEQDALLRKMARQQELIISHLGIVENTGEINGEKSDQHVRAIRGNS